MSYDTPADAFEMLLKKWVDGSSSAQLRSISWAALQAKDRVYVRRTVDLVTSGIYEPSAHEMEEARKCMRENSTL